jgi:hypothetical protein
MLGQLGLVSRPVLNVTSDHQGIVKNDYGPPELNDYGVLAGLMDQDRTIEKYPQLVSFVGETSSWPYRALWTLTCQMRARAL